MSRLEHVLHVPGKSRVNLGTWSRKPACERKNQPRNCAMGDDDELHNRTYETFEDNTNTAVSLAIWYWWNTSLKYSDLKGGRDPKRVLLYESLQEGITDWESLGKAWSAMKKLLEDEGFTSKEDKEDMEETFALLKPRILYELKDTVEYKAIMAENVEREEGKSPDALDPNYWLYGRLPEDYPVFSKERGDEIAEWLMKYKNADDGLDAAAQEIARAWTTGSTWQVQLTERLHAIRDQLKAVRDSRPQARYPGLYN